MIINDSKIILTDEPTGNLDSKMGKSKIELLISLAN
jgi:ABC-type lipoprotein export system ATPase subunit